MAEFSASLVWATPIIEVKNPDHGRLADALVRHCYESERRSKAPIASGVTPLRKANLYESTFDFFKSDVPEVQELARFCAESVSRVVFQLRNRAQGGSATTGRIGVDLVEAWCHITRDGGYHESHTHPNCSWCGIYYTQIGQCSVDPLNGVNRFHSPIEIGYDDLGTSAYPQKPLTITPENGKLVLFPSYVRHWAVPYRGTTDRVIISFNSRVFAPPA